MPAKLIIDIPAKPRNLYLKTIVNSGELGAEIAALRAAKTHGIATKGHCRHYYQTVDARMMFYEKKYNLLDDCPTTEDYLWYNIEESDATIRISNCFATRRELLSLKYLQQQKKPMLDVWLKESLWTYENGTQTEYALTPLDVATWILSNGVKTLNVTGGCDIAIQDRVYKFMLKVINLLLWE